MAEPLLGNHQKCWVRGRHAVLGALWAGPGGTRTRSGWRTPPTPAAADEIRRTCRPRGVPVVPANGANLSKLCGRDHQGVAAKMPPFPYADADQILADPPPLTVICDGVQDPQNLGAILRSAAEFAADAVLIPTTNAVGVTAGVAHSGAGAVGHVPVRPHKRPFARGAGPAAERRAGRRGGFSRMTRCRPGRRTYRRPPTGRWCWSSGRNGGASRRRWRNWRTCG